MPSVVSFTIINDAPQNEQNAGLLPFEYDYQVRALFNETSVIAGIEEYETEWLGEEITYYANEESLLTCLGEGQLAENLYNFKFYRDEECSIEAGTIAFESDLIAENCDIDTFVRASADLEAGLAHLFINMSQSFDLADQQNTEADEEDESDDEDDSDDEDEAICACLDHDETGVTYLVAFEDEGANWAQVFDFDTQELIGKVFGVRMAEDGTAEAEKNVTWKFNSQ